MTSAERYPSRNEADDDALDALQREDALHDASRLVVGGLVGIALGAGLGWLASRSVAVRSSEVPAMDDVASAARRAAEALDQSRADVERHVARGLRDLRRAVRHAARRDG